ncbi:Glycosyltransferase family GT90 [Gracilaria domingensis]|nr:Glycosyltransferase family GT90 [Gracilaria domingensis]
MRVAIPTNPHIPNQENVTVQIQLPGAIASEGKKFENLEGDVEEKRSSNLLPGAIGLTGSFDEHGNSLETEGNKEATESAKTPEQGRRNETSPQGKMEQAASPLSASSDQDAPSKEQTEQKGNSAAKKGKKKKGKKKKGKKKKKKKKKKSSNSPGTTESKTSPTAVTDENGANKAGSKLESASEGSEASGSSVKHDPRKNETSEDKTNSESTPNQGEQAQISSATTTENKKESVSSSKDGAEHSVKSSSEGKGKKKSKKKKKKKGKKKSEALNKPFTVNSTYTGPHPMNRNMEELQVPADTGILDDSKVRSYYQKLVKAYLAPFGDGIDRRSFFEILRRKTYSLSPPGSNKGIQTILFQLVEKSTYNTSRFGTHTASFGFLLTKLLYTELYLLDPYEMTKNSKPFYKTRIQELVGLLSDIAKEGNVPDTEFIVAVHDCVQTVNAEHTYRGSVYQESSPTFTIVSCNFSDNIPFPMWEGDPVRGD